MDSIGKMIIAAGVAVIGTGVAVTSTSYFLKYWDETRRMLLGRAVVTGTSILPDSFPVQGVIFNTLVKARLEHL